jgi:hypothetical protein
LVAKKYPVMDASAATMNPPNAARLFRDDTLEDFLVCVDAPISRSATIFDVYI